MAYINFPHQVAKIDVLEQILERVDGLIGSGENVDDDGVLGYACVRSGLYHQKRKPADLESWIANQLTKSASSQGPRTWARDVRRTFALFGLLRTGPGGWQVTDRGRRILAARTGQVGRALGTAEWATSLLSLKFRAATDEPGVNETARVRPLRVMLEMLSVTSQPTLNLALAFGVEDESEASFAALRATVNSVATGVVSQESALAAAGATSSLARDNVKIIPSMADQLGLISREPVATLTAVGQLALEDMRSRRPVWAFDIGADNSECVAACVMLVVLQVEDVAEDDASVLLSSTGKSVSEAIDALRGSGIAVEPQNRTLHLASDISFDPYQDAPDDIFAHRAYQAALARLSTSVGSCLTPAVGAAPLPAAAARRRRVVRSRPLEVAETAEPEVGEERETSALSYEELLARRERASIARERRQGEHRRMVRLVGDFYAERYAVEPRCSQLYDLFLVADGELFVAHEVKTITPEDERDRIREAVGQLMYYQYFERPGLVGEDAEVVNVVAVDRPLSDAKHGDFLASLGIGLIWADGDKLYFEGPAAEVLNRLPPA